MKTGMYRHVPPRSGDSDVLDIEMAMEYLIENATEEVHEEVDPMVKRMRVSHDVTLLATQVDVFPDYRTCEQYGLAPPMKCSKTPTDDLHIEDRRPLSDRHDLSVYDTPSGTAAPIDVPVSVQAEDSSMDMYHLGEDEQDRRREQLYESAGKTIMEMLSEGEWHVPITRKVVVEIESERPMQMVDPNKEPWEVKMEQIETRKKPVTAGHKRVYVGGVVLGQDVYHRTQREAARAYHEHVDRVVNETMIVEDFSPYVRDPPAHIVDQSSGSFVRLYGEPVDWEAMCDEIGIMGLRDLSKEEQEELEVAIRAEWPEGVLL